MPIRLDKLIFRSLVYFCKFLKFTPTECFNKLTEAFTSFHYCSQTIFNWYDELTTESTIIPQKSGAGRQINDEVERRIRQFLKESPNATAQGISLNLKIPRSTVRRYLYDVIGLERVKAFFIPHELTEKLKQQRMYFAMVQLAVLKQCESCQFSNIVTGDESWFNYTYYSYYFYVPRGSKRPYVTHDKRGTRKIMIILFFTGSGLLYLDALDHNATIDAEKMRTDVIPRIQHAWNNSWSGKPESEKEMILQCTNQALEAGEEVISKNHLARLPTLPMNENLADSDRLMVPIRTSLFTQSIIEPTDANMVASSVDEENGDNYHEEQDLPGYIIISSDDDDDDSERASKRKAKHLLEQVTQEELSFRESLHQQTTIPPTIIPPQKNISTLPTSEETNLVPPLGRGLLHMDNASPHNAEKVRILLSSSSFLRLCHPPNSPDLAPSDFWLFSHLKKQLEYQNTKDKESLLQSLRIIVDRIPCEMWQKVFRDWEQRLEWVIANGGDYYPAHIKEAKRIPRDVKAPLETPQNPFRVLPELINVTPDNQKSTPLKTPNSEPQTPTLKVPEPNLSPLHEKESSLRSHLILFTNLGNTCYINSLLQCLLSISTLSSFLLSETTRLNERSQLTAHLSVIPYLESLFQRIHSPASASSTEPLLFEPRQFVERVSTLHPDFKLGKQADQHQLFQILIEKMV